MEQRRLLVLDSSQSSDTLVEQRFMMRQRELLESSSYTHQQTWAFRPVKPKNTSHAQARCRHPPQPIRHT
jgi:hypothetical protein